MNESPCRTCILYAKCAIKYRRLTGQTKGVFVNLIRKDCEILDDWLNKLVTAYLRGNYKYEEYDRLLDDIRLSFIMKRV